MTALVLTVAMLLDCVSALAMEVQPMSTKGTNYAAGGSTDPEPDPGDTRTSYALTAHVVL